MMNSVDNECENLRFLNRKYIEHLKAGQKKAHQLILLTKSTGNVETSKSSDQIELDNDFRTDKKDEFKLSTEILATDNDINSLKLDRDFLKDARLKLNSSKEFSSTVPKSILKNNSDKKDGRYAPVDNNTEKKNERKKKLLFSEGNDRQNASTVLELAKRKQKNLFHEVKNL